MKLILSILVIAVTLFAKADAWDNLTAEQASQVKEFVERNPFIFDFCDCCGSEVEVFLIKVESAKIVKCSWDKKQFSVVTKGRRIAKMQWAGVGLDDYHAEFMDEAIEYTIFMNYTFVFDPHMKWAVPLFKMIEYAHDGPICIGATNYPSPEYEGVQINDQDYLDWYHKNIKESEEE